MTFALIEILYQAITQINSFDFRNDHDKGTVPRRLRYVVVTCPTAMVQREQVALRQCAEDASKALANYFVGNNSGTVSDLDRKKFQTEVIPSVKDLKKSLSQLEDKKDWNFDEATCCQLVFIYAEISKRYLNNCGKFFEMYGKLRNDLDNYDKKSVTIGSIDIGGGTTDMMICSYKYSDSGTTVLTPVPLLWESFNIAGDDLLREIIEQIIIEGKITSEQFKGCSGVIANHARELNVENIEAKLNAFFHTDHRRKQRQIRKEFNTQVLIPIAEQYLEHAKRMQKDRDNLTYEDFFQEYQPNQSLLEAFEAHFGFKFQDIKWKLSTEKVNEVVSEIFEKLIRQVSLLFHAKRCDFVLLTGQPSTLQIIGDLFLKYYAVSPDRIINLNHYRVGRWYPFQDHNGYFEDKKSIVAVGAALGLMAGKLGKLQSFRFDMSEVKRRVISTAEYIGLYDRELKTIKEVIFTPDQNKVRFKVDGMPSIIGFKKLAAVTYPARMIFTLDFNYEEIARRRAEKTGVTDKELLNREVDEYITKLTPKLPFTLQVSRDYRESREELSIESIEDVNREVLPSSLFKLSLKTLDEDTAYWLDTGEFIPKIKTK